MKNETKKRAKSMLPAIKTLISQRALSDPDKNRETLADELRNEIQELYPQEVPPAWETILKRISKARKHGASPEDAPWYLGTLNQHPLSAEAIHHILKVQKWMVKQGIRYPVTLRQAKWISRLYKAVGKDTYWLWKVSYAYTLFEILCEISDTDFDTSKLDEALRTGRNQFHKVATELVWIGDIHGAARYQHIGLGNGKAYKKWANQEYNQSEVNNERTHTKKR